MAISILWRKLVGLRYPRAKGFNIKRLKDVMHLVIWLEDSKIRFYSIQDRKGLRSTDDKNLWIRSFMEYLKNLQCPYVEGRNHIGDLVLGEVDLLTWFEGCGGDEGRDDVRGMMMVVFDWLLNFGLRHVYEDCEVRYNNASRLNTAGDNSVDDMEVDFSQSKDKDQTKDKDLAFSGLDYFCKALKESEEEGGGVNVLKDEEIQKILVKIANVLQIPFVYDSNGQLDVINTNQIRTVWQGIVSVVSARLSHEWLEEEQQRIENGKEDAWRRSTTLLDSGQNLAGGLYGSDDEMVNRSAVVLRLLHVRELRILQNDINRIIGIAQMYTSNTKVKS